MPDRIDLGEFRHRLTLQASTPTRGPSGQDLPGWTTVGTYPAAVTTISGRELIAATQIKSTINHKVTMRTNGLTIASSARLLFEGTTRAFVIEVVFRVGEMNEFFELWCSEDTSNF